VAVETQPLLELRGVSKTYADGTEALAEIDLEVHPGETLGLVGESGSGKTTLMRLLNRLHEPSAGVIRFEGRSLESYEPTALRRRTGYVPQDGGLLPHWTVRRNVELVPELLRWPAERRRRRSDELLRLVGLDPAELGGRYPRSLSGGQRQRVAFARALAGEPAWILLDEPFGALDAINRRELRRQFRELAKRLELTAVLITHDLAEAFELADRTAVLAGGRLLQVGTADELRSAPAHPYVELLLEAAGVA
jgi:osmoprotectant transport system ATP-binding protein